MAFSEPSTSGRCEKRRSTFVDAVRALAYREAAEAGAEFITEIWVAKRLYKSKHWVRNNWLKTYEQVEAGDIWPPHSESGMNKHGTKRPDMEDTRDERVKKLMKTTIVKPLVELPEFNRPMPFIETNADGTFQINDLARKALHTNGKPVCVVAIVGKYRTGKSFLMNRLYGRNSGFPLGGTVEAETKGIWMWQRQHPQDPSKSLLLLDTEGLYDVNKGDTTNDMKLFTLAVLLSSCFVFNIQATIDDAMVQQLHLVSELTGHIKTKSHTDETGADFSKYFPSFVLVVRDFFLELTIQGKSCTPDQYLDHALRYKSGHSSEVKKYNAPRECIKEYFTRRKCFVLPKPVDDDQKILELEKVPEKGLKADFLTKADQAVSQILQEAVTFKVQENPLTGQSFGELAEVYVNAMNSGQVPCMESAVSMLRETECHKAKDMATASYILRMTERACPEMPMETEHLSTLHKEAMQGATELFRKHALFDEEGKFVKDLLDDVNLMYQEFVRQNETESTDHCQKQLKEFYSEVDKKISRSSYNKEGGYERYKEDCDMANAMYASVPNKGPMAQTVLTNYLKRRENEGYTIMNADKALCEKAKELAQLEVEREHQRLSAEAERERNEALRQQMEDEKVNNQKMLDQHMADIEQRLTEQQVNHDRIIREKEQALAKMRQEGNERADKLDRDLEKLRDERRQMDSNRGQMRQELQEFQRKNNDLLQELRNIKNSNAATADKLKQIQAQAPPRPRKKKGCSIM